MQPDHFQGGADRVEVQWCVVLELRAPKVHLGMRDPINPGERGKSGPCGVDGEHAIESEDGDHRLK